MSTTPIARLLPVDALIDAEESDRSLSALTGLCAGSTGALLLGLSQPLAGMAIFATVALFFGYHLRAAGREGARDRKTVAPLIQHNTALAKALQPISQQLLAALADELRAQPRHGRPLETGAWVGRMTWAVTPEGLEPEGIALYAAAHAPESTSTWPHIRVGEGRTTTRQQVDAPTAGSAPAQITPQRAYSRPLTSSFLAHAQGVAGFDGRVVGWDMVEQAIGRALPASLRHAPKHGQAPSLLRCTTDPFDL